MSERQPKTMMERFLEAADALKDSPPPVQRFWLNNEGQLRTLRLGAVPLTAEKGGLLLGPELVVDAVENPWPDRVVADYRSTRQRFADDERGLRAFEVCEESYPLTPTGESSTA